MNKKGFTMVELLVVIALIAIMAVLLTINMTGVLSEQRGMSFKTLKGEMESAACAYIDKQKNIDLRNQYKHNPAGGTITLNTLITSGLIDGEVIDPRNNKTLEEEGNVTITIKWVDKVKQCTLNE